MPHKNQPAVCVKSTYFKTKKSLVKVLQQSPQSPPYFD